MVNAITPEIEEVEPQSIDESELQPALTKKPPIQDLLVWNAPIRPFKTRSREFYTTAGSIIFLACIILLFLHEYLLIMVLIALGFFSYVTGTVPPEEVEHRITNRGVISNGKTYPWEVLGRFWFEIKWKDEALMIEHAGWPARLMLLLGKTDKKQVVEILSPYLEEERPEKTQMERASEWLGQKIPLETHQQ